MLDLQSRLIAANYIYIPPQTPPLEKVGLVANLQFAPFGVGKLGIVSILGIELIYYRNSYAVALLLSERSMLRYARYLWHAIQKSRGA